MPHSWSIEPTNQVCSVIRWNVPSGHRVVRLLLLSDSHIDSKHHLTRVNRKLLELAKRENAPVIKLGDTFDAMQGPHDKRADKGSTKPEHDAPDYFDRLVNSAADVYEPFASQLAYIGTGNHETAVLKHSGTNLITRLCQELKYRTGRTVIPGGYRGWIRFQFQHHKTSRHSRNLYWNHGAGGGGEMTFGTIKVKRRAAYVPDADIVAGGHIHEDWNGRIARYRLSAQGVESLDHQLHICCPSLKEPQAGKAFAWEHEKEMPPKPCGAYWLTFTVTSCDVVPNAVRIIPEELE